MINQKMFFIKILTKILKWIILFILLVLIAIFAVKLVNMSKIYFATRNGIYEEKYIDLGNIKQYIEICGENIDNPIVVFLHGGPGSPAPYVSYYYRKELQSLYTFVNWDQRGCGKTYFKNQNLHINNELSVNILLNDLDELVNYLTLRFNKDKVIIMGHSWGTALGTLYVKEHPEKVSAYIGVSQCINIFDGQAFISEAAMEYAKENNDTEYIENMSSMLSTLMNTKSFEDFNMGNLTAMRRLVRKYIVSDKELPFLKQMWLTITSPNIAINDIRWFLKSDGFKIQAPLFDYLFFQFDLYKDSKDYASPVYYIVGDKDTITPSSTIEEYYNTINAPDKDIIILKDVGHVPFMEDPKGFNDAVKEVLKNIDM